MRILYVNDALAIWGGLERILVDKVNLLSKLYSYEMYLVTVNQGNHPIPYPLDSKVVHKDLGIQFHQQYKYHGLRRLFVHIQLERIFKNRLKKCIQETTPDVIVCVRSELVKTICQVKGSIPLVYESHTSRNAQKFLKSDFYTRLKASLYNYHVKKAQLVVTLTEGDASDWSSINPHVCVIPNVVNLNESGRTSDCLSKSVIFVGRFSTQKDIGSLLKIWQIIHNNYPEWQLQIYGGYGEEQNVLLPQIERMNANINVHKPTPEIFLHYMDNSILLLTSVFEPFGLVLPEAMSCGLPVVAFDCPYGPSDIITDSIDGYLIKDRNIEAFASKVCQLIENPEMRKKMGKVGILSSQRYHASTIMPKWKRLFEEISNK